MEAIPTLEPGQVFAGDYEVQRPLAKGGMGAVYVVLQRSTGRQRALKTMLPSTLADASLRARFEREATVSSRIQSDHVVEVLAAGVDAPTGLPWLTMELLQGSDLGAVLKQRGALPPREAAEVLRQLGHALSAAHRAGVVHRDLKPENVFLAAPRSAGVAFTVKVLDFGIAKILQESITSGTSTQAIGSPLWMSPEQTEAGSRIGPPADVFSLGLLTFRVLTGYGFWRAANTKGATYGAVIREMLVDAIPAASARAAEYGAAALVPPGFDAWFARCVARDPGARYADASQAIPPLLALLESQTSAAQAIPRTMALPQHVVETAISQAASPPTHVGTGAVLGAAPTVAAPAPPAPPKPRGAARVAAAASAFVAIASVVGVLAARTMSGSANASSTEAKPPPGAPIGPIPEIAPGLDAGSAAPGAPAVTGTDVPAAQGVPSRMARATPGLDAGQSAVPTLLDAGGPKPPDDVGHSPIPVFDVGVPPPRDAGRTVVPALDAGSPAQPMAHDAGSPAQPAAHDAGPSTPSAPAPTPDPPPSTLDPCGDRHTCNDCNLRIGCGWCARLNRCVSESRQGEDAYRGCDFAATARRCPSGAEACAHITRCRDCTEASFCTWCPSQRRCLGSGSASWTCVGTVHFAHDCE